MVAAPLLWAELESWPPDHAKRSVLVARQADMLAVRVQAPLDEE